MPVSALSTSSRSRSRPFEHDDALQRRNESRVLLPPPDERAGGIVFEQLRSLRASGSPSLPPAPEEPPVPAPPLVLPPLPATEAGSPPAPAPPVDDVPPALAAPAPPALADDEAATPAPVGVVEPFWLVGPPVEAPPLPATALALEAPPASFSALHASAPKQQATAIDRLVEQGRRSTTSRHHRGFARRRRAGRAWHRACR